MSMPAGAETSAAHNREQAGCQSGGQAVLSVKNLTKNFGRHTAVNNLSFDVNRGDIFGFLGPNGAGKSTTMYMMAGLVAPTSGHIEIFGRQYNESPDVRAGIGFMIEPPAFYEYLSGRKNLEVYARIHGGKLNPGRIDEVLSRVGLLDRANDRVRHYSHGMKQRLGIAQALVHQPQLLLLDEPTNGLDPEGSGQVWELLRTLVAKENITVFISSHLLHEVEEGCNRIAVINQGILMACDEVSSLLFFSKEDHLLIFESADARDAAEKALRLRPDLEVLELEPDQLSSATQPDLCVRIRMHQGQSSGLLRSLVEGGFSPRAVIPLRKTLKQFFLELTRRQPSAGE
jgi:ABC-2 type transport system ATP-binding protein